MSDIACAHIGLPGSAPVIPVSLLNRLARERLEATFPLCWVAGEISNLSHAASGHLYFSLKDSAAQVRCVMFRSRAQILGWRLENGQQIEARVLVTLYEARGDFQLNVEAARRGGIGNLYERFLRLQDQLASEGLFDSAAKRSLPTFPQRIGIITSPQAAALRDVLSTLRRRAGHVAIVLYPTPVQGEGAARQIAEAILGAGARRECELLIVCRGGGSIEDLWAFNDEAVARAIRACSLPVICGIGHETDFTIADFAADQRAPTPTAAAEIAAPERAALLARLAAGELALRRQIEQQLNQRGQHLDWLAHRLQHPAQYLARQHERLRKPAAPPRCWTAASQRARARDAGGPQPSPAAARPDPARHAGHLEALAPRLRGAWSRHCRASPPTSPASQPVSNTSTRRRSSRAATASSPTRRADRAREQQSLEPGQQSLSSSTVDSADAAVLAVSEDDGQPLPAAALPAPQAANRIACRNASEAGSQQVFTSSIFPS
jgi:exodeoxyribonuclease VII large subunit